MYKKIYVMLSVCLLSSLFYVSASCFAGTISVGEAFKIVVAEVSTRDGINLKTHFFIIYANATPDEMHDITGHGPHAVMEREKMKKMLKDRLFAAISFMNKEYYGRAFGLVVTYYIDLTTREIFYIERTV